MYLEPGKPCFLKQDMASIAFRPACIRVDQDGEIDIVGHLLRYDDLTKCPERPMAMIERVIFNDPATIVIWSDKTKTVVKCQPGDTYDPEKGLALCISKKFLGNKGNFNEVFKKWIPEKIDDDAIRVGSRVKVIDNGKTYDTYAKWITRNVTNAADRLKWESCRAAPNGALGHVKYIAKHGEYDNELLAYVDFGAYGTVMNLKGLKKD